jgi:hypothetical protein
MLAPRSRELNAEGSRVLVNQPLERVTVREPMSVERTLLRPEIVPSDCRPSNPTALPDERKLSRTVVVGPLERTDEVELERENTVADRPEGVVICCRVDSRVRTVPPGAGGR